MKELMQKLRESSVKEILDCDSAERLEAMRVDTAPDGQPLG